MEELKSVTIKFIFTHTRWKEEEIAINVDENGYNS